MKQLTAKEYSIATAGYFPEISIYNDNGRD